jgi:H+/gluconate symporter-like permease
VNISHIFWQSFWILLVWVPLVLLWAIALFDIFFRNTEPGIKKLGWVVLVLVIPYVGAIIYLLRRESSRVEHHDDAPVRSTPEAAVDALQRASALHDAGKLSDTEFAEVKRSLVHPS